MNKHILQIVKIFIYSEIKVEVGVVLLKNPFQYATLVFFQTLRIFLNENLINRSLLADIIVTSAINISKAVKVPVISVVFVVVLFRLCVWGCACFAEQPVV